MAALSREQLGWITAQQVHVLVGALVVLGAYLFFPGDFDALFVAVAGLMGLVTFKEFYWDPRNEEGETIQTGAVDWSFYPVGLVLGFVLHYLAHYL